MKPLWALLIGLFGLGLGVLLERGAGLSARHAFVVANTGEQLETVRVLAASSSCWIGTLRPRAVGACVLKANAEDSASVTATTADGGVLLWYLDTYVARGTNGVTGVLLDSAPQNVSSRVVW